jgi:hypothetical protein
MNDNSPMSKLGCGGKGCVIKRGDQWVILNNKKAGYPVWRSGFKSEADAKKMAYSKKQDEKYDAKMAYNKNLSGKARLHYLENNIADHKGGSWMSKHSKSR